MKSPYYTLSLFLVLGSVFCFHRTAKSADAVIPHAQDKPPGPALTPAEAIEKMTVPEGFTVELVASEPNIVNPIGMAIDERGRFWITESLEYPRRDAGPGKDRVKILEDTDGDGKADKFTIFADGLNIPSGSETRLPRRAAAILGTTVMIASAPNEPSTAPGWCQGGRIAQRAAF